jgi:hypothetical protein
MNPTDEEQAIVVFLKGFFESAGMPNALWIVNESKTLRMCEQFSIATATSVKPRNALSNRMAAISPEVVPAATATSASRFVSRGAMFPCKL